MPVGLQAGVDDGAVDRHPLPVPLEVVVKARGVRLSVRVITVSHHTLQGTRHQAEALTPLTPGLYTLTHIATCSLDQEPPVLASPSEMRGCPDVFWRYSHLMVSV